MRSRSTLIALVASLGALSMSATAAPIIYVHDARATLAMLDLASGQSQVVGILPSVMTDIALSPGGELYGIDFTSLWQIDPETAKATRIGDTGYTLNALTFAPDGSLYAAGACLVSLDISTAAATLIGNLTPFASAGDLVFDSDGRLLLSTTDNKLLRLDPNNAGHSLIGGLGHNNVYGLAMVDGTLYGVSNTERVSFPINPATAAAGPAIPLPPSLAGAYGATSGATNQPVAAVVPEPVGLCVGAAVVLLLSRRRRTR